MSGGLILGVGYSLGQLKYWVAAIQSSWFPESRVIRAVPLPRLVIISNVCMTLM